MAAHRLQLADLIGPLDAFGHGAQVQGSGQILMDDGSVMRVGFGGTNNQPYRSIGSWLIEHRELAPAQASMQGIKGWARAHPGQVEALLEGRAVLDGAP